MRNKPKTIFVTDPLWALFLLQVLLCTLLLVINRPRQLLSHQHLVISHQHSEWERTSAHILKCHIPPCPKKKKRERKYWKEKCNKKLRVCKIRTKMHSRVRIKASAAAVCVKERQLFLVTLSRSPPELTRTRSTNGLPVKEWVWRWISSRWRKKTKKTQSGPNFESYFSPRSLRKTPKTDADVHVNGLL